MYIRSSLHAYEILKKRIQSSTVEEFWVIALNSQLKCLGLKAIARGTVDHCHVHPRDIFLYAIKNNGTQILIAHNHINKNTSPSREDISTTKALLDAADTLQIPIIDHLIIATDNYTSFADHNWFKIKIAN